jgi:hypothetical protein
MWRDIEVTNVKATSFFKCDLSLISSNVKLACFLAWKSLMVNYAQFPPPSCCTKHTSNSNYIEFFWFLDYTTFKTFDKTNSTVYRSLMST